MQAGVIPQRSASSHCARLAWPTALMWSSEPMPQGGTQISSQGIGGQVVWRSGGKATCNQPWGSCASRCDGRGVVLAVCEQSGLQPRSILLLEVDVTSQKADFKADPARGRQGASCKSDQVQPFRLFLEIDVLEVRRGCWQTVAGASTCCPFNHT